MKIRTGARGRPRKVPVDPASPQFAALFARLESARAREGVALDAHAVAPTQAALVALLDARIGVCAIRGHIAEAAGDDSAYKHETELLTKLTNSRNGEARALWFDDLARLHAEVVERRAVHAEIARDIAADAGALDDGEDDEEVDP